METWHLRKILIFSSEKGSAPFLIVQRQFLFEAVRNQYRVPVDDNLQNDEIRNMELWSFEIIYKLRLEHKKGPVLVHCHAGMQRSACVVAMYLIATANMKVEQAIAYIQSKRPITFRPGANFLRAIQGFEAAYDKEIRPKLIV